jgi:hypothetical protein
VGGGYVGGSKGGANANMDEPPLGDILTM